MKKLITRFSTACIITSLSIFTTIYAADNDITITSKNTLDSNAPEYQELIQSFIDIYSDNTINSIENNGIELKVLSSLSDGNNFSKILLSLTDKTSNRFTDYTELYFELLENGKPINIERELLNTNTRFDENSNSVLLDLDTIAQHELYSNKIDAFSITKLYNRKYSNEDLDLLSLYKNNTIEVLSIDPKDYNINISEYYYYENGGGIGSSDATEALEVLEMDSLNIPISNTTNDFLSNIGFIDDSLRIQLKTINEMRISDEKHLNSIIISNSNDEDILYNPSREITWSDKNNLEDDYVYTEYIYPEINKESMLESLAVTGFFSENEIIEGDWVIPLEIKDDLLTFELKPDEKILLDEEIQVNKIFISPLGLIIDVIVNYNTLQDTEDEEYDIYTTYRDKEYEIYIKYTNGEVQYFENPASSYTFDTDMEVSSAIYKYSDFIDVENFDEIVIEGVSFK